ncbi:hypothetical protein P170DRAFT_457067 [Aspergillus steynii IBT 23096]|uniref:Zn(II)2Cys6 transcription factor n=1 Tax=Aspergillus steynii IBT 23096 TaxID=1392250 RepID=A0A2I2G0J2_9EURO|nr:uncharacterized protein P170DRAFT_457067 [Aspergillus steynii IBT 23096]PLB46400.1 hypothetical protein P170DRAFT_457067 [Aspergillus steynii IBT 23096]
MRPKLSFRKPRSRAKDGPAFVFVDQADGLSSGTSDQDARAVIRRQAARSGRKHRRDEYASPETRDGLVAATQSQTAEDDDTWNRNMQLKVSSPSPKLSPSLNGYETLRVKYNFDITDLTSFTDVDLGRIAYLSLRDHPTRLASLLQKRSSSFLAFLPSRYGSSSYLDDAMHCVAARAGQMLGFPVRASTLSVLYVKALRSLQDVILDKAQILGPDVYCATRLLALYELLGLPDANHWVHHNRGGIKLVELRGPANHRTRFDLMLIKSQGPSIVIDSMYRQEASFFEAPEWQKFFKNASIGDADPDLSLWWEFFGAISFMPGILKDMRLLFTDTSFQLECKRRASEILERTRRMHTSLHENHIRYQRKYPCPPSLFDLPASVESPDRVRLRGFFLYVIMYISRVKATLSPDQSERVASEVEAQAFATQTLLIEQMTARLDPAMTWHLEQRNALPYSIVQTRDEWLSDVDPKMSQEELELFLARRWLKWEDSWRDAVLKAELTVTEISE